MELFDFIQSGIRSISQIIQNRNIGSIRFFNVGKSGIKRHSSIVQFYYVINAILVATCHLKAIGSFHWQ